VRIDGKEKVGGLPGHLSSLTLKRQPPAPSAASDNIGPVGLAEPFVVGVVVAPDDVATIHPAQLAVAVVACAIEGEAVQT
jgi:hypothetical protein